VAWQIENIGQVLSPDEQHMRWSYVIVLRETAGSAIEFQRVDVGSRAEGMEITGGLTSSPFARTLPAQGELRIPNVDTWGWSRQSGNPFGGAAALRTVMVEYRFIEQASGGEPVSVAVRMRLDRSVGKLVRPAVSTTGALPPQRTLSDLASLAGPWRGSVRADGDVFHVPIDLTFAADGTVHVAVNDPVTVQARATASVRDGRLEYSADPLSGAFRLHEDQGQRILAGYVSPPRQGSRTPVGYTIRVRWQGP
jgi:hypothetical protein